MLNKNEYKYAKIFIVEEVPKSIGLSYVTHKIKSCFDLKKKDDLWRNRKKE